MANGLSYIASQYELHNKLFKNVVEDLEKEKADRPTDATNHSAWIAGHIVSARFFVANMLGVPDQEPYSELFGQGKAIEDGVSYPSLSDQLNHFNDINLKIGDKLRNIEEEKLKEAAPFPLPTGETVGDLINFLAHHEAYHIGQLGLLRKYFGKEAMKYD